MDPPVPLSATMPSFNLQMIMAVEILLIALFDGGLIVMGITCISLLTNASRKTPYRKFWRAYVSVLIFLNISFLLEVFLRAFSWVIYNSSPEKSQKASFTAYYASALTVQTMVVLTDGVLVSSSEMTCIWGMLLTQYIGV